MNNKKIILIKNFNLINNNRNFVFSALNLSFLSFLCKGIIKIPNNYYLWCDGLVGKLIYNVKKTPGSAFISYFYDKKYFKIILIGNYTSTQINFLKKKFKCKIQGIKIPLIKNNELKSYVPKISKNNLILITLPTPKQEILAYEITKKNKNFKIICIGGGLSIATGEIKSCPKFLSDLGFEFLWRLRTDTYRRVKRLLLTGILFIFYYGIGKIGKLRIIKA